MGDGLPGWGEGNKRGGGGGGGWGGGEGMKAKGGKGINGGGRKRRDGRRNWKTVVFNGVEKKRCRGMAVVRHGVPSV